MYPKNILHKNNFTFLRLVAAVSVIISHSFDVVGKASFEPLSYFTNNKVEFSSFGLATFFFISGYFITASATNTNSVFKFCLKRIYRIYPALIVLVLVSVFIAGPLLTILSIPQYFADKESWLYLFTATGLRIRMILPGVFSTDAFNIKGFNASIWTIALEIELYISVAAAMWLGLLKRSFIYTVLTLLISLICFGTMALKQGITFDMARHLNLIAIFYLGAFTYISAMQRSLVKAILLISVLLFIIFTLLNLFGFNPIPFFLIAVCMVVYWFGFTYKIKIPLQTDISYGLYIYAFPVQQAIYMFTGIRNPYIMIVASILCTLPFAFASWYLIEKKFIGLKHTISN